MGGADVVGQFLAEGLVDEVSLHVVPVLSGGGVPLNSRDGNRVELETIDVVRTAGAAHFRDGVVR